MVNHWEKVENILSKYENLTLRFCDQICNIRYKAMILFALRPLDIWILIEI